MARYRYYCGCGRCTVGAITGPLMLITLGVLFALDQTGRFSFTETWPVLLIVYGLARAVAYMAPAHESQ
jgi:hypothetical protein